MLKKKFVLFQKFNPSFIKSISCSALTICYDNFRLYCIKIDVNKYYLEFYAEKHLFLLFLVKDLPKMSTSILNFLLNSWHLLWRVFWQSGADRRIKTNKFLTDFQVKMNITVTLFGKRISGKLLYEKWPQKVHKQFIFI